MRRQYEFALVVTLIGILALFLMGALERARGELEESMVQSEAAAIRVALMDAVVHRETGGGNLPASANPLAWVDVRPQNYAGETDAVPAGRGLWYFDRPAGELVYRFRDGHRARFRFSREGGERGRGAVAGVGLIRLADRGD